MEQRHQSGPVSEISRSTLIEFPTGDTIAVEHRVVRADHDLEAISEQDIRNELAKVLRSTIFINSNRLSRFLRFTVEAVLSGQSDALKEYVIGV